MIRILIVMILMLGPALLTASRSDNTTGTTRTYTVKRGDSLYTIAKKFSLTVDALKKANDLKENDLLHPGQKLILPGMEKSTKTGTKTPIPKRQKRRISEKQSSKAGKHTPKKSPGIKIYQVRAGDTLSTIAQEKKVSVKALLKANRMKSGELIKVGQTLVIPEAQPTERGKNAAKARISSGKNSGGSKSKKKQAKNQSVHVVQYGDTLFSIARKYHTPLKDLMALNGISPTDVIHPGQELNIPGSSYRTQKGRKKPTGKKRKTTRKAAQVKPIIYIVKHGDTLWEIAKKHKVSVTEIRRLNKMKHKDIIRTGMKLLIKEGTTTVQTPPRIAKAKAKKTSKKIEKTYTVKRGDTLWEIAKRYKTSVAELRRLNNMSRTEIIHTGMKLTVGYEKVPPTRIAAKRSRKSRGDTTKRKNSKKVRTASVRKKKKIRKRKTGKDADKRINSALAALNSKGSGHRSGGGGDYDVIRTAKKYLGRRYVWGAEGPSSFDCSGFTQYVMRKSKGVKLPRVSRKQAYYGKYVTRSQLKPGDLIFFDTSRRRRGYVNHVGIYIGNGKFIHASSARHRVVITSLNSPFYRARFKWGRRVN